MVMNSGGCANLEARHSPGEYVMFPDRCFLLGHAKSFLFFEADQTHIFHAMISPLFAADFLVVRISLCSENQLYLHSLCFHLESW